MLLKIKPRFKTFNDYFSEADDDENTQDKSTMNKIVVKPHKRRGNDYTAMEPEPEDDTPADDATDYTDTSSATGNKDSNDDESNEPEDDTPEDDATDYTDTSGATGNEDSNDDNEDSSEDDGEGNDDAAVLADDSDAEGTDYTDTGDGGEGDDSDNSDDNQQDDQDQNKNDTEAYKKFYLFRKFSSLYNHINTYCKTLQSSSYDDVYYSTVIKAVIDRLSEVSKCINEYLIMKFDNVSYVEGCIYYETVFNIVKLSIEMLKNNSEKAKQLSK